ncbi:MAG: Kynureninase [Ferruginibacter sp.]|nr:Kynureninase [Ferruginibacter sp.]
MPHQYSLGYAIGLDTLDELSSFREQFYAPYLHGKRATYFLGNSLGLQPKNTQDEVLKIMEGWANFGVEGFFMGNDPWLNYHKHITPLLTDIIGAKQEELVTMNHLTVNLHLLMISFYQPTPTRYKIICEAKAFPSDQYALQSQVSLHGFDPANAIIEVYPKQGTELISKEDILAAIEEHGDSVALVLFSGVNYYTGQVFDIAGITAAVHKAGAYAGFDLAHAAGNIKLQLHYWKVDFAAWCNYKYLNSGPGAIAGAFVHEQHLAGKLPRLEGWWGNNISNRFKMEKTFTPSVTAESWSLSTTPMMLLAAHKASLEVFAAAGFENLLQKSKALGEYLFFVLTHINQPEEKFTIITPQNSDERGCQVSLSIHQNAKAIFDTLMPLGIFADWREPNVIRIAPVPLYNSFEEIFIFADTLRQLLNQ